MLSIARIPRAYESYLRDVVNQALQKIERGEVPEFAIDRHKQGESVITITESVASRHPTQESAA